MIKNKKIDKLKNEYINIDIPNELDDVVNDALNNKKANYKNRCVYVAASLAILIGSVNVNKTFANTLESIPVIGNIIKVVNLRNYKINENGIDLNIDTPKIEGLKNQELEYKLNKEFEEQGKEEYEKYLKELEILKKENKETYESIDNWYEVKTDNNKILSIALYKYSAMGSSNLEGKYYNIDKDREEVLTLEGMFYNTDYVKVISDNIKQQMKERMKKNSNDAYWLDDDYAENFNEIDKNQNFYINKDNDLVISFNKYEVSPGYMGIQEFIIPKDIIKSLLK